MNGLKEVAKFASGAEAFHALIHTVFLLTGTTLVVFGITFDQPWNIAGVLVNGLIALALGFYAWRRTGAVTRGGPAARASA